MARYKAGECYSYTGRQAGRISPVGKSMAGKYAMVQFANAEKRFWFQEKAEGFTGAVDGIVDSLNSAAFNQT
ncbi:MAG: hypothetical protein LBS91_07215 [Clostridiales Family XIII bacterium]|nr:hypothetical protein [Clostridiales Family XIII bacterium]